MTVSAPATSALAMSPEYCRPPSAITGTPAARGGQGRLVDGGDLRHADAGDDAGGADRARADADLDGVGAGVDERLRALAGRDVAADDVDVRERRVGLEPADDVEHARGVAVRGVDDEHVDARRRAGASARSQASPKKPIAAPTRRRPSSSLVAFGYCSVLSKSLTVMRPGRRPSSSTSGSFSILCWAKIATRVIGVDADRGR